VRRVSNDRVDMQAARSVDRGTRRAPRVDPAARTQVNQNSTRAGASPDLGLDLNRLGNTGSVLISRRRAEDARR